LLRVPLSETNAANEGMDASHESDLARILESRRSRGVLRGDSAAAAPSTSPVAMAPLQQQQQQQAASPPPSPAQPPLQQPPQQQAQPQQAPRTLVTSQESFMGRIESSMRDTSVNPQRPAAAAQPPTPRSASQLTSADGSGDWAAMKPTTLDEALFVKGRFDNFRTRPILVTDNVKPYRAASPSRAVVLAGNNSGAASGAAPTPMRRGDSFSGIYATGGRGASPGRGRVLDELPPSMSQRNPFREQSYDEFAAAPNYGTPDTVLAVLSRSDPQQLMARNAKQQDLQHPFKRSGAGTTRAEAQLYEQSVAEELLRRGDWFLKWTRKKDKVHQRYCHVSNRTLHWGKAPDIHMMLTSSVPIAEIVEIDSQCVVDEASGRTYYVMVVWTLMRTLQLGTEVREKFDLWFDTLMRITARTRQHNRAFHSRHATMEPVRTGITQSTSYNRHNATAD
jgi:hypothetical protein